MTKDKNIGLFFGSFNPIHNGHLMIANWMAEFTGLDQVWFVISPLNPFKTKTSLLPDYQRLELVNRAIADYPRFKASNIEFNLPRPSYTIDTLTYLKEQHPDYQFTLIMGSDQLPEFHRWKNSDQILEQYRILVYPRTDLRLQSDQKPVTGDQKPVTGDQLPVTGNQLPVTSNQQLVTSNQQPATSNQQPATISKLLSHPSLLLVPAPMIEISSSFIRQSIKEGRDVRFFMPPAVWEYVVEMHFYE